MVPPLPVIKGKEAVKAFQKAGWRIKSQKGSHVKLVKSGHPNSIIIPIHKNKDLDRGTLSSIIKSSNLTIDEFTKLL